ncbi:uncharacterized protein LOC113340889 [Papaver somniferum]|uniref:uncharacterized protein LOC113340889 n=1 Tax=Papaver somniferum TaxID=3469 RepID=UPI000E70394E|nr:uncharacterized protein LOC113340889 [Papaver somniferum]
MLSFWWEPGGGTISSMFSVMIFASHISVSKEVCAFENLPIEIEQGAASSSPTISSESCSKGVQEATANPKKSSLACDSVMTLLDMYAGMSTGLCMGAAASDVDLTFADYMFEIDTFQTMHGLDGRQTRIGDAATSSCFLILELIKRSYKVNPSSVLMGRKNCRIYCRYLELSM